jgi:hypothetical protein
MRRSAKRDIAQFDYAGACVLRITDCIDSALIVLILFKKVWAAGNAANHSAIQFSRKFVFRVLRVSAANQ